MSEHHGKGMRVRCDVLGDAYVDWAEAARTGASQRDVAEAFQHAAIYAGLPAGNRAL